MSDLARFIYPQLVMLAANPEGWINYKPLARRFLPQRRLSWRRGRLNEALGQIVNWCHEHDLPALPAIVVRVIDGRPGNGFYSVAFPGILDEQERRRLWREEVARLRQTFYPALTE